MTAAAFGISDGRALGGSMRIVVARPGDLEPARAAAEVVIAQIDAAASRFRDDSELSRLNASPERDVTVSPLLARAIATALRGARLSEGAVDPTVGAAVRLAGYDGDFEGVPADGPSMRLVEHRIPGWKAVRFSATLGTVRIPRAVEIDLGATAKALASDLAAEAASQAIAGGGVLVSLGGDIAVAGEPPAGGWSIQVSEDSAAPIRPGEETVSIASGGLATSSITVRRWTRGGAALHHIIDPATGLPVESRWRTATVAAATCVDANIAATAAIVKSEEAVPWLEAHHLAARLVDREGRVRRVAGWPEPADSEFAPNIF